MTGRFLIVVAMALLGVADRVVAEVAPNCLPGAPDSTLREHRFVEIGGIEQWLTIDGRSCGNPVVLFVHGGPGNPLTPFIDSLYGSWKDSYTLATWDQRLSGRTFGRNESIAELTEERIANTPLDLDRLVADGIEVAEYLRQRLGKTKLILTGGSWGSVVAVHMAHQRPELFQAYVGVSQLVNHQENLAASYRDVREIALRQNDRDSLQILAELGPPPWTHPRNFGRLRRIVRAYENAATTPGPDLEVAAEYASEADRAAYLAGEELSFVKYQGLRGDGMSAQVDLPALGTRFMIPVYLVQGEQDLLTRPDITRGWFETLQAPRKRLVLVPGAGHDPNFALLDAHLRVIRDEIHPDF